MRRIFKFLVNNYKTIFLSIIVIDVVMLTLHLLLGRQMHFFHLDYEANLPTAYQSLKLIVFGLIFFILGITRKFTGEIKYFIIPLSISMIFLGLDEGLQIHENIYRIFELFDWLHPSKIVAASMKMGYKSSLWILYYLPIIMLFVFWCGYWVRYFQSKIRSNFLIILISSFSLFVVLIAEVLSSTGSYSEASYFILITFEEVAELIFASTLTLIGLKILHRYG